MRAKSWRRTALGELTFEYTNSDGSSYTIDFPTIDGVETARRSLLQRCRD